VPLTLLRASPNVGRLETSRASFPPIPLPTSRLVGRQREIAEISALLRTQRVITLIGAAGSGKTRLALEVAARCADTRPNAACLVELAPLAEAALVPQAVAAALGINEEQKHSIVETLQHRLMNYDGLLVLDNCEHLVEACADLVDRLLRRCRRIVILATSREALHVDGEVVWAVPLLSVPAQNASVRNLMRSDAVQLFVDRARQVSPGFELTADNASSVGLICRQLDGLPLAIELASSRVSVVDVKTIGEQLTDRFRFLTDGFRTAPGRQRTLRAAIDWSYDLLTTPERQLFSRLSVFAGTFDIVSVEAVCTGGSVLQERVLDLVSRLLNKSLLVGVDTTGGQRRYRLLESIRAYALDRLREAGELERIRRRHAERFADLAYAGWHQAASADKYAYLGPSQGGWIARMVLELDNVREALGWSQSADRELHLRLATGMGRFCNNYGYASEGGAWLDAAIRSGVKAQPRLRADAAEAASLLAWRRRDHDAAESHASERLRLRRRLGDESLVAGALGTLGYVRIVAGRLKEAEAPIVKQLAIAEKLDDPALQESALYNLAILQANRGDFEAARLHLTRSLALAEGGGRNPTLIQGMLARVLLELRELESARAFNAKALVQRLELLDLNNLPFELYRAAELAFLERAPERAMRLKGAADAFRERGGLATEWMGAGGSRPWVARAERSLGKAAKTAWLEGRQLSAEEAVAYAVSSSGTPPPRATVTGEHSLSAREIEVSELVAQGMTNDQIATRLRLSKRTIDAHLEHIRGKLDVRSRVEIAAWLRARSEAALF
jgi:predicted ATPase/DNA-binding CsgD family transcriptional regulator